VKYIFTFSSITERKLDFLSRRPVQAVMLISFDVSEPLVAD
jgi:hypothetical protein